VARADLTLVPDLDRELGELYGRDLGEFTAARNELAKRLKKAGQNEEAESVAALAKPSISAWAVNQLARRDPDRVRALLEAGAELVDAQKNALAGKAGRFDAASRRHRQTIRALLPVASAALEAAGHRPSDAVKERIASSLRAASLDPEGRRLLESGRLEADFESAGLGLLAAIAPESLPAKRRGGADTQRESRVREARASLEAAQEEERRLASEAGEAERKAEEAAAAAAETAEQARSLNREVARAKKAVEQAEKALERLTSR
jgi:hypothetical protein